MRLDHEAITIIGAGGHAKVVVGSLLASGAKVGDILDHDEAVLGSSVLGHRVSGSPDELDALRARSAVIAVGDNRDRRRLATAIQANWTSVVHPAAFVDRSSTVGAGSVVFAGAIVQPAVEIGQHVIVNTAASIDHDCVVGDFTHVAPGASVGGDVKLGEGVLVGIGATIAPGMELGDWAQVGAGAVVIEHVPAGATVVGVPARPLERD